MKKRDFLGCILRISSEGNIILRKSFETWEEAFNFAGDFKNCKIEIDGERLSFEIEQYDNEFKDGKYDLEERENSLHHFNTITYGQFYMIAANKFSEPEAYFRYVYPASNKYKIIGFLKIYGISEQDE